MNIILDVGNVLINFKPRVFLGGLFHERSLAEKIYKTIFESEEWIRLDEGVITHKEAREIFCALEPDFQPAIMHTMDRLIDMLTPITETIDLLPKIKGFGHGLYYLSNYHKELREYILKKYSFFDLFDGGVFSCDVRVTKPSALIYRLFLDKYGLVPNECVFYDDVEENVMAAQKEGINGVLFTGAENINSYLGCSV